MGSSSCIWDSSTNVPISIMIVCIHESQTLNSTPWHKSGSYTSVSLNLSYMVYSKLELSCLGTICVDVVGS